MSVQPAGEKPLPASVRRLLVIVTLLSGALFIGLSLWFIGQMPAFDRLDKSSSLAVAGFERLDVPCSPWMAPNGRHFLCVRDGALHTGTRGMRETVPLVPLTAVGGDVWDVAWLSPTRALVILQPLEESSNEWPLYLVNVPDAEVTPVGAALSGTSLQVLPTGLAYRSAEGDLVVLFADGRRTSVPLGAPSALYPFVLDEARIFLDQTGEPRFVARLIAGSEAGVLSLLSLPDTRTTVLDIHAARGDQTFAWAPHTPLVAFVTQDEEGDGQILWAFDAERQARRLVWESPRPGTVEFLTWLPSGTLLFAFLPSPYDDGRSTAYYAWHPEQARPTFLFRNGHGLQLVGERHILVYREQPEGEAPPSFWLVRLAPRPSP